MLGLGEHITVTIKELESYISQLGYSFLEWATGPQFYAQCGMVILSIAISFLIVNALKNYIPILKNEPKEGPLYLIRKTIHDIDDLLFPLFSVFTLAIAVELSTLVLHQSGLLRIVQGLAVIVLLYTFISHFIKKQIIKTLIKWVGIPVAILQVFGWLDDVSNFLDTIDMQVGNIEVSLFDLARVLVFGSLLFWLGRISNNVGQQLIRNQEDLELGTREVFAKLFEVGLFVVIFILLLQVMGINLTALAVFGGAVGVGLGFGLQAIASNFISGIIILLDRSITVGDYIELEDGRTGIIRELKMRSTTLETFDGKDIMVPNEQFITTNFINWTHKNKKQRYSIEFQVAYKTDLHKLFGILREVVARHPQVISGEDIPIEERPDAEIAGFGDSGVDILIEFWMEGIDDGPNRVGADLLLMIWDALKENDMEIPFPQREVKILNPQ